MFHRRKRGHKRTGRKDRLIQTRVGELLELAIKAEAKKRRITVSHLLRNVLEDYFNLVDDVVDEQPIDEEAGKREDSEELENRPPVDDEKANVEQTADRDEIEKDPLGHIYAWNKVVVSQNVLCSICNGLIKKGRDGYIGLSDEARGDRSWLCKSCLDKL